MSDPTRAPIEPLLLTPEEVAAALRMGRSKIYRYLGEGRIPSVLEDGSRRVRVSDLEAYVEHLETNRETP